MSEIIIHHGSNDSDNEGGSMQFDRQRSQDESSKSVFGPENDIPVSQESDILDQMSETERKRYENMLRLRSAMQQEGPASWQMQG